MMLSQQQLANMQTTAGVLVTSHILDATLQEHCPLGEPMTGSLGKKKQTHQTKIFVFWFLMMLQLCPPPGV
jgi:hypothetical protein